MAIANLSPDRIPGQGEPVVEVDIARTLFEARVLRGPAYDPQGSRMRVRKS